MPRLFRLSDPQNLYPVRLTIVALVAAFLCLSLPVHASDEKICVKDIAGRKIYIPVNPKRIIGLSASIVEIVYDLGKGDLLVGAVSHSDFPADAQKLPVVGSYNKPDHEKILSLGPDLCIAMMDGNPEDSVSRIEKLGIPVFVVDTSGLNGIYQSVYALGNILDAASRADMITKSMKNRIASVQEKVQKAGKRPGVIFEVNEEPLIVAGSGNFIDEMITIAGGVNVAGDAVEYPRISREKAVSAMPDVIIISGMVEEKRNRIWWTGFRNIPAVKNGRIHTVSPDIFLRPTPRIVDCIEKLARFIHPEVF